MRRTVLTTVALCGALALSACGGAESPEEPAAPAAETDVAQTVAPQADDPQTQETAPMASAALQSGDAQPRGTVEFREVPTGVEVLVEADGLQPGFHGLHLHEFGACEPDSENPNDPGSTGDFLSSGGHLGDGDHPDHAGDLPSLLVLEDGTAHLRFVTDRVDADTLLDEDGTAVIVHGNEDNFANIPNRYASDGADDDTLGTGDAGERMACGVVEGQ